MELIIYEQPLIVAPGIHLQISQRSSPNHFHPRAKRPRPYLTLKKIGKNTKEKLHKVSTCRGWTLPYLLQRGMSPKRWNLWIFPSKDSQNTVNFILWFFYFGWEKIRHFHNTLLHRQEAPFSFGFSFDFAAVRHRAEPFARKVIFHLVEMKIDSFWWIHIFLQPSINSFFTKHHTSFTISGLLWSTSKWPFSIMTNLFVVAL